MSIARLEYIHEVVIGFAFAHVLRLGLAYTCVTRMLQLVQLWRNTLTVVIYGEVKITNSNNISPLFLKAQSE